TSAARTGHTFLTTLNQGFRGTPWGRLGRKIGARQRPVERLKSGRAGACRNGCRCIRDSRARARGAVALSARRSLLRDARARACGGAVPPPHALPARPRPDRPFEGFPPAE